MMKSKIPVVSSYSSSPANRPRVRSTSRPGRLEKAKDIVKVDTISTTDVTLNKGQIQDEDLVGDGHGADSHESKMHELEQIANYTETKYELKESLNLEPIDLPSHRPIPVGAVPLKSLPEIGAQHRNKSLVMRFSDAKRFGSCFIDLLEDKTIKRIFTFLNHSDLLICRLVQKRWNRFVAISNPNFLKKTVYIANIAKSYNVATDFMIYNDLTKYAHLPFQHARFQYIDHKFLKDPQKFNFHNSDNEKYFPNQRFLHSLTSLEYRSCFLLWQTVKSYLVKAVSLETLKISNCHLSEYLPKVGPSSTSEFDEFNAGNAMFGLKKLEIYETNCLSNITSFLSKFVGYANQNLTSISITYYPPADRAGTDDDTKQDGFDFCRELKSLISLCANSLQVLILDVQHDATLNLLGHHVVKELEALGARLELVEFQLSPSLSCWIYRPELIPKLNLAITDSDTKSTKDAATSLARFLESQSNLEVLALPCIEHPEEFSSCFRSVLKRLPCADKLKYLAVPSAGFLPKDLLHRFPNLKGLKVGSSCCQDYSSGWKIFHLYMHPLEQIEFPDTPQGSDSKLVAIEGGLKIVKRQPKSLTQLDTELEESLQMMKRIQELYLTTTIIPSNFRIFVKSLSNLITLDISSGTVFPVITDEDLQACIKYLANLRNLLIGCCDNLTDFGITGIPRQYCRAMFKNQNYFKEGAINERIWNSKFVHGRPLSDFKGLRKLVLMGKCTFTDIGIAYGLEFRELEYCHLPYSDTITSWGIERFGSKNPSLQAFGLSGVSQLTKEAFLELRRNHGRLNGDASKSGYFIEQTSPIVEDFSLVLPTPEDVKEMISFVGELLHWLYRILTLGRNAVHAS